MKKTPKGRPKKAKGDQRTDTLRIRLTDSERAELDAAAKGRGLETSTWSRMLLLESARPAVNRTSGG
jgi:hypothetical protein